MVDDGLAGPCTDYLGDDIFFGAHRPQSTLFCLSSFDTNNIVLQTKIEEKELHILNHFNRANISLSTFC